MTEFASHHTEAKSRFIFLLKKFGQMFEIAQKFRTCKKFFGKIYERTILQVTKSNVNN